MLDTQAFGFTIITKSAIAKFEAVNFIKTTTIPSITVIPNIIISLIAFCHFCSNIYYFFLSLSQEVQ